MLDDRFEDRLQKAARDYNAPPETPREEMWTAIRAEMAEKAEGTAAEGAEEKEAEGAGGTEAEGSRVDQGRVLPFRRFRPSARPPVRLAAAIAALLALGFAVGRLTEKADAPAVVPPTLATAERPHVNETAYRAATTDHLSQSEAFLTLFRASVRRGGNEQLASATAKQLLATNRLLLDSPAATDARTRTLLQDLELVLAEIAQLSPQPRSGDLDLIKEGLEQGGVLTRLRTVVPSGASTTQGAL